MYCTSTSVFSATIWIHSQFSALSVPLDSADNQYFTVSKTLNIFILNIKEIILPTKDFFPNQTDQYVLSRNQNIEQLYFTNNPVL